MYEPEDLHLTKYGYDISLKADEIIKANDPNVAAEIGKYTDPLPQRDIARIGYILKLVDAELKRLNERINELEKKLSPKKK